MSGSRSGKKAPRGFQSLFCGGTFDWLRWGQFGKMLPSGERLSAILPADDHERTIIFHGLPQVRFYLYVGFALLIAVMATIGALFIGDALGLNTWIRDGLAFVVIIGTLALLTRGVRALLDGPP